MGTRDSGSPNELIFLNEDGTETHVFFGRPFSAYGNGDHEGVVFTVTRTNWLGTVTYETITDVVRIVYWDASFPHANAFAQVFGGADTLNGWSGSDILAGGPGGDVLNGGSGVDFASYEHAAGPVTASLGDPSQNTGEAAGDQYSSIEGLIGSQFHDTLIGDAGDNIFIGRLHDSDFMDGGDGFDLVSFEHSTTAIGVHLGRTIPDGGGNSFKSVEGAIGSAFDDSIVGNADANYIVGGDGNDQFLTDGGEDTLIGGKGNDQYIVNGVASILKERPGEGVDHLITTQSEVSLTSYTHIENVSYLGGANAKVTGDRRANVVGGDLGDDIIDGGGGADSMDGGRGGNDTFYVDNLYDTITDNGGIETVYSSVSYHLHDQLEKMTLTGDKPIAAYGGSIVNELTGNDAANLIDGGGGVDTLVGKGGDDTYVVDTFHEVIVEAEGGGNDTVRATLDTLKLAANVENLIYVKLGNFVGTGNALANKITGQAGSDNLAGGDGDDTLFGNGGNDKLSGEGGNDLLDGGSGADVMWGALGDDTYRVDNIGDVVIEAAAGGNDEVISSISYTLGAYVENLTLTGATNGTGNKFANELTGSDLANTLDGGFGADRLTGGGGDDTLTGGRDGDSFVFRAGFGHDAITDFTVSGASHDVLEFDSAVFADTGAFFDASADTADGVLVTVDTGSSLLIRGTTVVQLATHLEDFHFV